MKKIIFFFAVFFCFSSEGEGQIFNSRLDLAAGVGVRDYLHGGARYQYYDFAQIGFYVGNDWEIHSEENITTFSFDHLLHFGHTSLITERPYWYIRTGYTFSRNELSEDELRKYSYMNLGVGRELPVNDFFGLNLDLGLIWQFREYIENKNIPLETPLNNYWYVFPMARLQFFISF